MATGAIAGNGERVAVRDGFFRGVGLRLAKA
jgi:hypothetical protein